MKIAGLRDSDLSEWDDIAYLTAGTPRQQQAYQALRRLKIFEILAGYKPTLVGTIPLDIDLPGSDLDIICQVAGLDPFAQLLRAQFSHRPGFSLRHRRHNQLPVVVCNFVASGFPIEVFGQPRPVKAQNAYRHLVAEARLLALAGPEAKAAIRHLKTKGLKTEPAFGRYFALPGDPYETLLALAGAPDSTLQTVIEQAS
jgi:hypothetical protein